MTEIFLDELKTYLFPDISEEIISSPIYKDHIQNYFTISQTTYFYRGYLKPSINLRAQIYRAVELSDKNKEFIIFYSFNGIIIRSFTQTPNSISTDFDFYFHQGDEFVFIPPNYHQIKETELSYYQKLIQSFCQSERVNGKILSMQERANTFLFLALIKKDETLPTKWSEFLTGGVTRLYNFPANRLQAVLDTFSWKVRESFNLANDGQIIIKVRSTSLDDFEEKHNQIIEKANNPDFYMTDWYKLDLQKNIKSQQAAFGITRLLAQEWQVLPLVNTNRIYLKNKGYRTCNNELFQIAEKNFLSDQLKNIVNLEGWDPISLTDYSEMDNWEIFGLIGLDSGHFCSVLDLVQLSKNPLTQQEFSLEFSENLKNLVNLMPTTFRKGYPIQSFKPELIIKPKEKNISCYIKTNKENLFWKISYNLPENVIDYIVELINIKWTNGSIFSNLTHWDDYKLLFNPQAYHVFDENIDETNLSKIKEKLRILDSL